MGKPTILGDVAGSRISGEWSQFKTMMKSSVASRVAKSDLNSTDAYFATKN